MKIVDRCPICESVGEDGGHLFFKCRLATEVWSYLNLDRERISLASTALARDAVDLILKSKEDCRLLMIITMWFIWHERNLIREEGRRRDAQFIAQCIKSYADENVSALEGNSGAVSRLPNHSQKWSKPPPGFLKLNYDASFIPSSLSGSWGFLIRDCDGDVVMAGKGKIDHLLNAFHAELIACLQGIQTTVDLGIGRLIVETDAKMVVRAITSEAFDDTAVGVLIAEIKALVADCFINFECVFKVRECNRAAHELAKLGHLCI
jgi:ribonuclease HI